MGTSYMIMLIAFYVDNGSHLTVWRVFPPISYWLVPLAVGVSIIARALRVHPMVRRASNLG